MGNAFGGWFEPAASTKEGTVLVELAIKKLSEAHDIAGLRPSGTYTPVVLAPQQSAATCCCLPACWVSIPEGFSAIVTNFGAVVEGDEGKTWSPGFHWFSPLYNVDKVITKRLIVFDTPVKDVKTKNFIPVTIDAIIVFEVTQAYDFVYTIGADKFDDYLRAEQDDALRRMGFETDVENIFDLQGANTSHILEEMNQKFEKYGVKVHSFTIRSVTIPKEMAKDLEDKTLFESLTTMSKMEDSSKRMQLKSQEGKEKLREECTNSKMAAEQKAEVMKNEVIKKTAEVVAQTTRDIAELEASRDVEAKQVLTNGELEVAKIKSQILAMEREVKSKTEAECGKILAEAEAFAKQKETQTKIEVAKKLANGRKAVGEAEGEASAAFAARRAHEAEMKRLDILEQVTLRQGVKLATSQENTMGLSQDNQLVTQVAQQGLEAMRAKLAEVTFSALAKLEAKPGQQQMIKS